MKLAAAERHADLYPDRHLNVFVPYRAHDLDYNVTRALITTLRWSRPGLTQAFLQQVGGVEGPGEGYQFDLQSCDYEDFDPATAKQQVLLGISVAGKLADLPPHDDPERCATLLSVLRAPVGYPAKLAEVRRILARPDLDDDDLAVLHHTLEELDEGCMPDGWVFNPAGDGVCLLIEAKLTRLLDLSQIQRYGDVYFNKEVSAEEIVLKSWEDIAAFFASHTGDSDPQTAFLCKQLCDYLDLLGLAPFSGFKPYDFDPDSAQEALPKFRRWIGELVRQGDEQGLPLSDVRPSPTGVRIAFSNPDLPGELRVDLRQDGIRVEHRSGDSPSGNHSGRAAVDRLLERSSDGESNPLEGAEAGGMRVRIERMRSTDPYGEAFVELETLSLELDTAEFGFVLSELRRQHPPATEARQISGHFRRAALSMGRTISKEDALAAGADVTGSAVETVSALVQLAKKLIPEQE